MVVTSTSRPTPPTMTIFFHGRWRPSVPGRGGAVAGIELFESLRSSCIWAKAGLLPDDGPCHELGMRDELGGSPALRLGGSRVPGSDERSFCRNAARSWAKSRIVV